MILAGRGRALIRQYLQFCLVGFGNLAVDLSVYLLLTRNIGFFNHWRVAGHMVSFSVAVVNSYIWNCWWVFRAGRAQDRKDEAVRFTKFVVVQAIGLGISSVTFVFLTTPHWLVPDSLMRRHGSEVARLLYGFLAEHRIFPPDMVFVLGPLKLRGDVIAKLITAVVVSLWNFPANKLWIFRKGRSSAPKAEGVPG